MTIAEETSPHKQDRGLLRVDVNECKGCGLCIEACPPKAIHLSEQLNHYGYRTATYNGSGCTGSWSSTTSNLTIDCGGTGTSQSCVVTLTRTSKASCN